jgi:predicted nucleic acid-binding protein
VSDGYLADTSIFIAAEQRRTIGQAPAGDARVSVATLTELIVGVRRSSAGPLRTLRETTLARARSFVAISYDEHVAERLGELLAAAKSTGRRAGAMDAIIAATAVAHGLTVWTQDSDFDVFADLMPALVVHRS